MDNRVSIRSAYEQMLTLGCASSLSLRHHTHRRKFSRHRVPREVLSAMRATNLRGSAALIFLAIVSLIATGCGSAHTNASGKGTTYSFVFDNNFVGNDYRPQLLRLAKLTAELPPFKGHVALKEVESQNTVAAQIADVNNIIRSHPDVLLLEPADPAALAPVINRACAAGIVVVDVDQSANSKCAWTVAEDFYHGQYIIGEWMADQLNGHGSVFVDQGQPGPNISSAIEGGFLAGLKSAGPSIKVAATYAGNYANAPSEQAIGNLLPANRSIAGIMNQGYCEPAFTALSHAGLSPVPATCFGYNGSMQVCAQTGHACAAETGSPTSIQVAMTLALSIIEKKSFEGKAVPARGTTIPNPQYIYVTNAATFKPKQTFGIPILQIAAGKTFYPNLPPGVALPLSLSQYKVNVSQEVGQG
jgi:ribose transport system substrate-binding protein